jgi:hypothetical protein
MDLFLQGDFESCADISICDRTPQKVTIEPIMAYTVRSFKFILKVGVKKPIMNTLQCAQKCGSKFFDWSHKMTLFYRDLFYAWQRRYLN